MNPTIDGLHNDHKHFAELLDLLNDQIERVKQERTPDFPLMLDILDYIKSYPDQIHHPREDAIYRAALRHEGEHREVINALLKEHEALKHMAADIYYSTAALLDDGTIDRDEYVGTMCRYIEQQRQHIDVEEGQVFPVLADILTDDDWVEADAIIPLRADPLFGHDVLEQYGKLYDHIVAAR